MTSVHIYITYFYCGANLLKIRMMWVSLLIVLIVFINFYPSFVRAKDVIYTDEVVVLVYHHIDDQVQGSVTISTKLFERQLEAMQRKGYQFITMDQFKSFMSEGTMVPDNAVLVTFDDGYKSFYTNAFPILKKMRVPAVNFVITKDLDNPDGTPLPSLTREEIIKMRKEFAGIDFQGHSDGLHAMQNGKPMLTNKMTTNGITETDDEFKQRVHKDALTCFSKLRELNGSKSVDSYAYPFGSYDEVAIRNLQEAGVKYAFTTKAGIVSVRTDPMQIPRINAGSPFIRVHSINNLINKAKRHQLETIQY